MFNSLRRRLHRLEFTVGAGGIGTALDLQRNGGNWPNIGVILIGITLTVGVVDYFSAKLRARLT